MSSAIETLPEENDSPSRLFKTHRDFEEEAPPLITIEPRKGWQLIDLGELWRYRELLFILTWRDVKVRYKQTVLGAAWAILQPLATMIVFSLFFGRVAAAPAASWPYPLFVLSGLIPWMFFSNSISSAAQSIVTNQNMVTKIYFPRLAIPISTVAAGIVDFAVSLGLLLVMMIFYGTFPDWTIVTVPLLVLSLVIAALGIGTLLAALTVTYRDFRYVVPFMVQLWMFATPSIYLQAEHSLGSRWRLLLPLNPAQGLIANFRQAVLGGPIDLYSLTVSSAVGVVLLMVGFLYFRKVESGFADII